MKCEIKAQFLKVGRRILTTAVIAVASALFFVLCFSERAAAVTKTWDGGGGTSNWSDTVNWSGDTVPAASDDVVFDGTSTKNATIDVSITVSSIQIAGSYTGTITQSNAAAIQVAGCNGRPCFLQNAGIFNGSGNTITLNSSGFGGLTLNGGAFNGGSGDITIVPDGDPSFSDHNLRLFGGTFQSTSGNLTLPRSFNLQNPGSVFLHNNGTVTFTTTQNSALVNDADHPSITFNNVNFNLANGMNFRVGPRMIVLGNLALNDGSLSDNGSVIEVRGTVSTSPNFDGANASLEFAGGSGPRTITLGVGLNHPKIIINDPNVTVNTSGSGTLALAHQLDIRNGVFNQGSVDLTISPPGVEGQPCIRQTGGTFNGSGNTVTLNSSGFGTVFMTGGVFNGASGDIIATGDSSEDHYIRVLNGATFKSTSGTLYISRALIVESDDPFPASTFNPNGGTVVFKGGGFPGFFQTDGVQNTVITFNNLVINRNNLEPMQLFGTLRVIVNGTLSFLDGTFDSPPGLAIIEARGNVNFGANFDGMTNRIKLRFSGFACQTMTLNGTENFPGDWEVDKSGCGITSLGNFGVHSIFVPNGSFFFGEGSHANLTGGLLIDPNGRVTVSGNTVINVGEGVISGTLILPEDNNVINVGEGVISGSLELPSNNNVINVGEGIVSGTVDLSGLDNTVRLDSLSIDVGGQFMAEEAETIILGGDVVNNGLINLHGFGSKCAPFAGSYVSLQSSITGTRRNWTGTGVFRMVHVNVTDMGGTAQIKAHNSVNSGNTDANWTFDSVCRASVLHALADFDGDSKSDLSVFRPTDGNWYAIKSGGGVLVQNWGIVTDNVAPGDFDGDGLADTTVFRPSDGNWYIIRSSDLTVSVVNWGISGDRPVAGDYDGDGKTDMAVFRPSDGNWYIIGTTSGVQVVNWGISTDVITPGDYDGDGKTDVAVFRPSDGNWYIIGTTSGVQVVNWGTSGDRPVPGDYDGDGKMDVAVFRPSDGNWYIIGSTSGVQVVNWGVASDITVPGDYDGDGKNDVAVFRPSDGNWYIIGTTSGVQVVNWGTSGDVPIPAKYIP
jgi:hypothetical protein